MITHRIGDVLTVGLSMDDVAQLVRGERLKFSDQSFSGLIVLDSQRWRSQSSSQMQLSAIAHGSNLIAVVSRSTLDRIALGISGVRMMSGKFMLFGGNTAVEAQRAFQYMGGEHNDKSL